MTDTQEIRCQECNEVIERRYSKGRDPIYCDTCRVEARKRTAREAQRRKRTGT